ncbi:MAG: hypothetical protein MUF48_10980 [Pirellulaceae bacterium]|jgi:hypothetical protein|nr:hypothetical protein [Pirellulaceae bacterium]
MHCCRVERLCAVGIALLLCCGLAAARAALGQGDESPAEADLRAGRTFLPTQVYSHEEDQRIVKLFEGLRVADVFDGMDRAGLQGIGAVDSEIQQLGLPEDDSVR